MGTHRQKSTSLLPNGLMGLASFRELFGVDLRTLALFRILLGFYIIFDLILRARDLTAHYSDQGLLPRIDALDTVSLSSFSLHFFNGSAFFQIFLFVIAGLMAVMLILGWRTRLAVFGCWLFMLSLQNRNSLILSGEDNLAMLLLCWAIFLPLGARYSVDAALDKNSDKITNAYFSIATLGLLIQGMSMYFFSALLKSDPQWLPNGTAVYYALQLDYFITPFAYWFRQFESVLHGLTYYVYALELIGPILIFSPILHRPLRMILMLAFITMHLSFFLFLHIGLFPLISIIMNLTFMPGWIWDWIEKRISETPSENLTIWYDQDCGFCLKTCYILRTFLFLWRVPIRPAQSDTQAGALLEKHNSWVVGDGIEHHLKWDAMGRLVRASPVFWPLAKIMSFGPLHSAGTWVYDQVAAHRSKLSDVSSRCLPWKPVSVMPTFLGSLAALVFLGLITIQNISTVPATSFQVSETFRLVRQFFGFYQFWTMFAPHPEMNSPWPVIPGNLVDGSAVDVYNKKLGAPSFVKPTYVAAIYANYRWRKFLSNMEDQSYENRPNKMALLYGRYLCRNWNRETAHQRKLSTFKIYFNVENTPPPGTAKVVQKRLVWSHNCFAR